MATARSFELGLLPERKLNWRSFATSYGFIALVVLIVVNIGLIWPERLQLHRYYVTELMPMPSVQPKPYKMKQAPLHAKLLPPAHVFDAPKLTVPREIRVVKMQPREVAPPKIVTGQFAPPVMKEVARRSALGQDRTHR